VREGKILHVAMSNTTGERLAESLELAEHEGLARYEWLQPHYNLVERSGYESEFAPVVERFGLKVAPYYALASGFLTGKYRNGTAGDSPRAETAASYLDARGRRVLDALDEVAAAHEVSVAAVAIAWLLAKPGVEAPIASARDAGQLAQVLPGVSLQLTAEQLSRLDEASA
jgi:aryl-alcohol dehydrogenase (NADP+)